MYDPDNAFEPELVDQQIEQPDSGLPRGSARLVRDLQAMYGQEKAAAIDRVWERIASDSYAAYPRPELLSRQEWRRESVRSLPVQQIDRTIKPAKRLPHILGLIAAALICVVLVGSLALILAAQRNAALPGVGSPHPTPTAQKNTATATATPAIPAQCQDTSFLSDETLCATGQETNLNITRTFGSLSVMFVRAYADSNQMLLVYKITGKFTDAISFTSITIQQGIVIGDRPGEAGAGGCFANSTGGYCLEKFSMQRILASSSEIRVQAIVDGFSNVTTPLHFTIPFHTAHKTVNVNQTVTSKGVALTLKSLVFTGSTLTMVFSPKLESSQNSVLFVSSIFINGQKIPVGSGLSTSDRELLDQALMGSSGAWEIEIVYISRDSHGKLKQQITWTFHFTVQK